MAIPPAHATDTRFLVRRAMTTGYQVFSFLAPPIYAAFVLARRGRKEFSLNRFLRATWLGGLAGSAGCGGFAHFWYAYSSEELVRQQRLRAAYDAYGRVRADDHAMIGTILSGVLTPALLWKRAHIVNLILGGAGLGSNIGLLTYLSRTVTDGPPPKVAVPDFLK